MRPGTAEEALGEAAAHESNGAEKSLLLLDVYGVLNVFPVGRIIVYRGHVVDGSSIHFHVEVRQMIAELAKVYEVVWFTLLNRSAGPPIGAYMGLAHIDSLETLCDRGEEILAQQGHPRYEVRWLM